MKKFIIPVLALFLVLILVACGKGNDPWADADRNATINLAFGNTSNINVLMATDGNAGSITDLITSSLFRMGYDWHNAIETGIADHIGDFSQIAPTGSTDGYSIEALGFTFHLHDAAAFPFSVSNATNFADGAVLDQYASRASLDDVWRVQIRNDLVWSNGDPITVDDYLFSIEQLINPNLNNGRANFVHSPQYLNLVGARAFFDGDITDFSEVGITAINDFEFELRLAAETSQWRLMQNLNLLSLVHRGQFLSGMNAEGTTTTFGSIDLIPYSHGSWILDSWEIDTHLVFVRHDAHHDSANVNFARINAPIIEGQRDIVNEWRAGNLDSAGVGGEFWPEFMDNPLVRLNPNSNFGRFDISLESPNPSERTRSPLVLNSYFRRALFLAIDRQQLATEIIGPAVPNIQFASSIAKVSDVSPSFMNQSTVVRQAFASRNLSPDTNGFNQQEARRLFDIAYGQLVAEGSIVYGQRAQLTFTFFEVDSNRRMADFFKPSLEAIFGADRFEFVLEGLPLELFTARRNAGDFDILFNFLSGAPNDAVFLLHFVFLEAEFMSGLGWDHLVNVPVTADLRFISDIIRNTPQADWVEGDAEFVAATNNAGIFTGPASGLIDLFQDTSRFLAEYQGRTEDLHQIAAAFTGVLLDEMPSIPVMSSVGAIVNSARVTVLPPAWHTIMGWGGLRYQFIGRQ